jgi:CRISPR/Cas system CSM-associated protein Csm3 (group 7 of RAMP superfamily)
MNKYQVIRADLVARTALHIGSGRGTELSDDLIRRDTTGAPIIPGSAIAGALRALITRLAPRLILRQDNFKPCDALLEKLEKSEEQPPCGCAVCHLFGDITPTDDKKSTASASRLLVFDASLVRDAQTTVGEMIRDGVGIDRVSGSAARAGAVKFDLEVLPAGSKFELRMELRDADPADEQLLAVGLSEWEHGRAWLGGRVARGLGAFDVSAWHLTELDLDDADNLMIFLKNDHPWKIASVDAADWLDARVSIAHTHVRTDAPNPFVARCWAQFTFTLQAQGAFLTNDAVASAVSGFDHAPLLAATETWDKPVLTGAGLRGVLRSHAERIARTLATRQALYAYDFGRFCPACDPNAKGKPDEDKRVPLESCDTLLLYQAKVAGDVESPPERMCLACQLFGSTRWGSRLIVEDAPLVGAPQYKMMDFLAIDRFTGGGSQGLKFDALALWQPAFRVRLFLDNPAEWELGWLALVLRDVWQRHVPIGFGAAKGFGDVTIAPTDWNCRIGFLAESDFPANQDQPGATFALSQVYDGVYRYAECRDDDTSTHAAWLALAENWSAQFRERVRLYWRDNEMCLTRDSYFGHTALMCAYSQKGGLG